MIRSIKPRRRDKRLAREMKRANQFAHAHQFLVGMRRLASRHEREDLYVSLETERARCPIEAHLMKVPKQCVHRRRPIARAATNGIATPLHPAQPSLPGTHSHSIAVDRSGRRSGVIPEQRRRAVSAADWYRDAQR